MSSLFNKTEVTVRPRVTLKSEAELEPGRKTMESVEAHCQEHTAPQSSRPD